MLILKKINLSNSSVGGNIWISERRNSTTNNIFVTDNYIEKSSHDESIALWKGSISNVIIDKNEFNLHEEKVENPSDMNFTFGNSGGQLTSALFQEK